MSNNDNAPVVVTGEERRHPAIRMLARACIALAQLRLEAEKNKKAPGAGAASEALEVGVPND
jgi:hypothetical protein